MGPLMQKTNYFYDRNVRPLRKSLSLFSFIKM